MKSHVIPETKCPNCGHSFTRQGELVRGRPPTAGDLTICCECLNVLVFERDLSIRQFTPEEIMACEPDLQAEIHQSIQAARLMFPQFEGSPHRNT